MRHTQSNGPDTFDAKKAVAAIVLLVQETQAMMYSVMKMLYLADKAHLEKHGRFITGDRYVAMQQGPVPSRAYDLVKHARGEEKLHDGDEIIREYLACDPQTHVITLKRPADLDELSVSDIECLSDIAGIYQRVGQWAIRDMSHDGAWKKVWERPLRLSKSVNLPMETIANELDETGELTKHLRDRFPGEAGAV